MEAAAQIPGMIFVTREECDLRSSAEAVAKKLGGLVSVATLGGYIVDVWDMDHWQSGLSR